MTDPFAILGVPRRFRLDLGALAQRHRELSRALHPDRHAQASPAERRLAIERAAAVNDAYRALKHPQSRAAALLAASGRVVEEHSRADSALLMEVMELREELDATRALPPDARAPAVARLRATVDARIAEEEAAIADAFDRGDDAGAPGAASTPAASPPPDDAALDRAYNALVRLRYFYRFVEEADAVLDDEARD